MKICDFFIFQYREKITLFDISNIILRDFKFHFFESSYFEFRNALTFLCRLLPATTIGDAVYGDEMSDFDCVTTQPGCPQMCYNLFAPMSHVRYWSLHVRKSKAGLKIWQWFRFCSWASRHLFSALSLLTTAPLMPQLRYQHISWQRNFQPLFAFWEYLDINFKGRYDDKKNNSDYTGSEQYTYAFPIHKYLQHLFLAKTLRILTRWRKKLARTLLKKQPSKSFGHQACGAGTSFR